MLQDEAPKSFDGDKDIFPRRLTLLLILVSLITINPRINGWNEASRMALTQSLVEQHAFIIDESTFSEGGDKVFIDGHFYSDKPPLASLLAAIVYAPLYALGFKLDFGWNLSYYLIILLTVKLLWIASVLAFRKALQLRDIPPKDILLLVMMFAFASLSFTWSATFNNHSLAGSSLMIGLMFYLENRRDESYRAVFWSGLMIGLAVSLDIPTMVFLIGFAWLTARSIGSKKMLSTYALGALIPLGIHTSINYAIGGTLLPLQIVPEFFDFEGSTWANNTALSGVSVNAIGFSIKYGFLSLFGPRGFVWFNPMLLLLVPLMIRSIRINNPFKMEAFVIISGSLVIMLYYFLFSSNYGGWSYSIRWFVSFLPLLGFFLFDLPSTFSLQSRKKLVLSLSIISIIVASVGLINPWSNPNLHVVPFIANLKQLMGFFL